MRSAILIAALFLYDPLAALTKFTMSDSVVAVGLFALIVFFVMDVMEFINKLSKD